MAWGVCAVLLYSVRHTKCVAVIVGYNQWCGNNINELMLAMMSVPLLVILLVAYHYICVSYSILPENGLNQTFK